MTKDSNQSSENRIKLVKPEIELKKPASTGSGLKIAGLIFTIGATLIWLISNSSTSEDNLSARQAPDSGAAAAEKVEELSKSLSELSTQQPEPEYKSMTVTNESPTTLNNVNFNLAIQKGWSTSVSGKQIFLRKGSDPRICQITADSAYDSDGLKADVKGKEEEFEAQLMKETIGAGIPGQMKITTTGKLLKSSSVGNSYSYAVRTKQTMVLGQKAKSQAGVNAVSTVGKKMVRLECMNMLDTSDAGNEMETMGRSLSIRTN